MPDFDTFLWIILGVAILATGLIVWAATPYMGDDNDGW